MRSIGVAACAMTFAGFSSAVHGEPVQPCTDRLTADAVVRCALERSPEVRSARLELDVVAGQRLSAQTILPQRPVLSASAGHRWAENQTAFDWYLTLAQEIEIGGQRGRRLDEVDAVAAAAVRKLSAVEHQVAAEALGAYWRFVAGRQRLALARDATRVSAQLGRLAQERRKEALIAPVDAEAAIELAVLLEIGNPSDLQTGDDLASGPRTPPPPDLVERALTLRGDLTAAEAERAAAERRVAVLERERVPSVTLSVSLQRDGFSESFFGVGLSLPIPLPSPVVPNGDGEIATARARSLQAEAQVAAIRRRVALEVKRAIANERASAAALRSFSTELIERARNDLDALGEALTARRMSIREALLAERSLLELVALHLEARLQYSLALTELWRAAGAPLDAGGRP